MTDRVAIDVTPAESVTRARTVFGPGVEKERVIWTPVPSLKPLLSTSHSVLVMSSAPSGSVDVDVNVFLPPATALDRARTEHRTGPIDDALLER